MLLETGVARDNGVLRDSGVSPGTVQSSLVRDSGVARDISVLRDSGVARIWLGLMSSNKSSRRWRLRETESV